MGEGRSGVSQGSFVSSLLGLKIIPDSVSGGGALPLGGLMALWQVALFLESPAFGARGLAR